MKRLSSVPIQDATQGELAKSRQDRTLGWLQQDRAIVCFFCNKPGYRIAQCNAKAASG